MTVKPRSRGRSRRPIFAAPTTLPRGPHALTGEQVGASQRLRLMAALVEAAAQKGYTATTIGDITRGAGVSPRSFYEHYENKLDCLFAAYDVFVEALLARMAANLRPDSDWHDFIASTLDGYLGALERDPVAARAFLIEMDSAGPLARRRRRRAYEQFAAVIKARHELIRARDRSLGALPDSVYLAFAHGVRELVCDALEAEPKPRLTALEPEISLWITATVQGAAVAARGTEARSRGPSAAAG